MNKKNIAFFAVLILIIFSVIRLTWISLPSFFEIWELQASDQIMRLAYQWQGKGKVSPYIMHIDLDDQTIATHKNAKEGYTSLFAQTIDILSEAGVESMLMDTMFLSPPAPEAKHKIQLSTRQADNVFFPLIISTGASWVTSSANPPILPKGSTFKLTVDEPDQMPAGHLVLSNFTGLNKAAAGLGHISSLPDRDGGYRRLPAIIKTDDQWVLSLALRTVCHYLHINPADIQVKLGEEILLPGATLPDGQEKDIHIPIDEMGIIRINFSGPWNDSLPHYSISTLLDITKTEDGIYALMDEMEGSIAVVSDISTSGSDFGPTPFSSYYPLSGLHANLINSILEQDFLHIGNLRDQLIMDTILILLLTIAACFGGRKWFALFSALTVMAFFGVVMLLFMRYRILLDPMRPLLSMMVAVPAVILCHFIQEQKNKQYIRARMSSYFAPSLMDKILKSPERLDAVEKKELTIMFSDIAGFTAWSSDTEASEIHQTLNEYFEEMARIVFKYEGTIDKYIGDGLMVFFGDPVYNENHPLLAVQAAIEMQEKTRILREKWQPEGRLPIRIRIGIHTGNVVVGNMGSSSRMDYTVIGSNVNLAQRLESNSEVDGIMISARVKELLKGRVAASSVGTINAKGFKEPVPVFSVDL